MFIRQSRRAVFDQFGTPSEVVRLETVTIPEPGQGQVSLQMHYSPINPGDMLLLSGQHMVRPPLPTGAGVEGVGVITAVGPGVTDLTPGMVAVPPLGGAWCDVLLCQANDLIPVPPELDRVQAAMLSVNPLTAHCLVHTIRPLDPGAWIVQTAANSAVGRMVIEQAHQAGYRTINVVRRMEVADSLYALGADVVLAMGDGLSSRVAAAVNGEQVLLALDAVGGQTARRLADSLSPGGTLVCYGLMGGPVLELPASRVIFESITVRGFSRLRALRQMGVAHARSIMADLARQIAADRMVTPVEQIYPLAEIQAAVRHAERENRSGKILLALAGSHPA